MRNKFNSLIIFSFLLSLGQAKGQILRPGPRPGYQPVDIMKQHAALPGIRPYVGDVVHAAANYTTSVRPKDKSRISYQKFYNGIIYITENLITHQISESAKIYNPDYNPSRPH